MQRAFIVLVLLACAAFGTLRFTPIGEPAMMWWELGRPPHALLTHPDDAGRQLHEALPDVRFEHTFYYGESAGQFESIEAAAARGAQLPPELQLDFFDGLGHGITVSDDDLDEQIAQVATHIPPRFRNHLYEGILRAYTEQFASDPERVVSFADAFTSRVGLANPYNGVRIGLQRALGHDLAHAIATARRYPAAYWPALFEELGWRSVVPHPDLPEDTFDPAAPFGDQPSTGALIDYLVAVPDDARCHFIHGAMRGRILERQGLDQAGWQSLETELTRLDTTCQTAGYRGIAWGIVVLSGRESSAAQSLLAHVTDPKARATITQNVHSVAQTGRMVPVSARAGLQVTAPWELSIEL